MVDVFASEEKAQELKKLIEEDYHSQKDDLETRFEFEFDGKEHFKDWVGYFSTMQEVHIDVMMVIPENEGTS